MERLVDERGMSGWGSKGEGTERRYFYGSVWAVAISQTILLVVWKVLPPTPTGNISKLIVYVGALAFSGLAAWQGMLPRTRPILPGELMVSD